MKRFALVTLAALLATPLVGCQPASFPRTGEVAAPGKPTVDAALQVVAYEPQRVTLANGRSLGSNVAFFPIISVDARFGIGGCEIGGLYAMTRVLAEVRCGIIQERRGAPFSLATSGAFGFDYGPHFGAVGRIGLDASVRLGPLRPLIDVYLSSSESIRWLEDHAPEQPPIEGPFPASKSVIRHELRITVPIGLAIQLHRGTGEYGDALSYSLVIGATPYRVIHIGSCRDCDAIASWTADMGVGFTLGLEVH